MRITAEDETGGALSLPVEELAAAVAEAVLDELGCPYEASAGLLVTDEAGIQELNSTMRGIDAVTDVLSFPALDFPAPGDFSFLEDDAVTADAFDPESGELILGDIAVCAQRVREQALAYGHSERREFAFLVAHSVLHLTGYDHETPDEAQVMEALQEKVLTGLGITRDTADREDRI